MRANQYAPKRLLQMVTLAVYAFLYVPIFVLIAYSFNNNQFTYAWKGFTLEWYGELLYSREFWDALYNSVFVAIFAVVLSLVLGVFFVICSHKSTAQRLLSLFYMSLAIPEIILAVGILTLFQLCSIPIGIVSLIVGHTLIGLGYMVPIVYSGYVGLDDHIVEASYDLGATKMKTFLFILFPLLLPSMLVASLLVFIVSFDDFVFSFFCTGAGGETLPIYIYSLIQSGATPVVNALSVLLLGVTSAVVMVLFFLQTKRVGI